MKMRKIISVTALIVSLTNPSLTWSQHMGGHQPPSHSQPPVQGQRPPEPNVWDSLDQTMDAVQRKREREAEAERIERGGGAHRPDGPMSRGERDSDRSHFLDKHRANERKMSVVVQKRQKLVNDMLNMYTKKPSPGLKEAIDRNSRKLSAEREELQRSRDFIRRND